MNVRYFIVSLLLLIFIYSCTVSIDGAPCNPELNNCPSGQYCTSDGVCKRGTPEVRDVTEVSDISVKDVNNDIPDGLTETFEDIIDVLSDTEDSGNDVKYDGGCVDECNISICKDNNMLLGCRDWDNDGCKEYKEVDCGGGSECKNNICICKSPYQDCNNDISDGCETDTNTNSERCGSCSNNCGQNSACNAGICGCKDGFDNCDGKWSNGCEVNLAEDLKNCGACNKDCGPNTYCTDMKCVCKTDYADCNQNEPGCETYLLSITSCGTTCEDIRNCGLNSVCNQGSCGCKSGYKDCNSDLSDGCETNILADINNCGYCKNECKPFNVNNPLCKNGLCDYDFCNEFFYDKDLKRDNGCEYWTNFPKRYDNNMAKDEASIILYDEEGMLIGGNTVNNQLWLM
ncbi:MAG: hypothetical protein N3B13_10175, partial [Deltaproteobacteria bacterium]|nr:hypothetical protein [Deltaproteobacteria bacterium]